MDKRLFVVLAWIGVVSAMPLADARAASWAQRAGQLNSRAVGRDEARLTAEEDHPDRRNKLSMRRINPADEGLDWNTDPTAIPFMLYQVNRRTDLPVYVDNDGLDLTADDLFESLTVYLTGHFGWSLNEAESENLAIWLRRGGTLLLDDCYNAGSPFTDSVNPEVGKLIPDAEPRMVLRSDSKVSHAFNMVYDMPWPGEGMGFMRPWQYYLLDGRPAVFFTPNDDGCGWEVSTPPTASNPLGEGIGHGGDNRARELFYKWITNWMLYAYSH